MAHQQFVSDQIRQIEQARLEHLKQAPGDGPNTMARVIGVGVETADMLVQGNRPLDAATDFGASFARALLRVLQIFPDDGSHISEHVRTSFAVLFPRLATPGIYVIEDMHTSYLPEFGGNSENLTDAHTSMALIKDLLDSVNDQYIPNRAPNSLDGQVEAVHVHPKIAFIYKGGEAKKFDGIVDQ